MPVTILVADDDPGMRSTLSEILRDHGYEVLTAANGAQAVEVCRSLSVNVALLDIVMPIMNGVEALERIRQESPDTRVVVMTAYAIPQLILEAQKKGADGFLSKPFRPDELLEMLRPAEAPG